MLSHSGPCRTCPSGNAYFLQICSKSCTAAGCGFCTPCSSCEEFNNRYDHSVRLLSTPTNNAHLRLPPGPDETKKSNVNNGLVLLCQCHCQRQSHSRSQQSGQRPVNASFHLHSLTPASQSHCELVKADDTSCAPSRHLDA